MAKVFLDLDDKFILFGSANVYGGASAEQVIITAGSTGVLIDQNVERIDLPGNSSDYMFQQAGNQLKIYGNGVLVVVASLQEDANGTLLVFANGASSAKVDTTGMTLGGSGISIVPATVAPNVIDHNINSSGVTTGLSGQSFTLTTDIDIKSLGMGDDIIDGSVADSLGSDTLIDALSTDSDTLNAVINGSVSPASIVNIENFNLTGRYGMVSLDGSNLLGVKLLTLSTESSSAAATVTGAGAASIAAIKSEGNISSLSVTNSTLGGAVSIDAGSTRELTINGATGQDIFTLTLPSGSSRVLLNGGGGIDSYTLNLMDSGVNVVGDTSNESLNLLSNTHASTVVLEVAGAATTTVSGSQSMVLSGADNMFSGKKVSNFLVADKTLTVRITGSASTADLSNVAANTIDLQGTGGAGSYIIADKANVKLNAVSATTLMGASGATTVNLDLANATPATITTALETINATVNAIDIAALIPAFGSTGTLNLSGNKNVTVTAAGVAKAVNATNLTGVLTETGIGVASSLIANVTGGSGADILTLGSFDTATTICGGVGNDIISFGTINTGDVKLVLDGGVGSDTLYFGGSADLSNGVNDRASVITGFEVIDIASNTVTLTQKQFFTNSNIFTLLGTGGDFRVLADSDPSTPKVFDLSGIQFQIGVAQPSITVIGATTASQITGTMVNDSLTGGVGADTINGGAGDDTIAGANGADIINVGIGVDVLKMTAAGQTFTAATATTIVSGVTALIGIDKVTGMMAGDKIDLSGIAGAFTGATGSTITSASGTTVVLVRGDFVDVNSVFSTNVSGTDTLLVYDADAAGAGTVVEAILLVGTAGVTGSVVAGVLTLS